MSNMTMRIQEIQPKDNSQTETIIKACFHEFGLPLVGTAYEDTETKRMCESYQNNDDIYYVVADKTKVYGGAGIRALLNNPTDKKVSELQKMYFSSEIRGKGFGKLLFEKCLKKAKQLVYEACYLESVSELKTAIHVYESFGFKHLESALGNTEHYSCSVWIMKAL